MRQLTKAQVSDKVGYSGMHIDRLEKAGKFPQRIRLSKARVVWLEHEIDAWIMERAETARGFHPQPKQFATAA